MERKCIASRRTQASKTFDFGVPFRKSACENDGSGGDIRDLRTLGAIAGEDDIDGRVFEFASLLDVVFRYLVCCRVIEGIHDEGEKDVLYIYIFFAAHEKSIEAQTSMADVVGR